MKKCVINTMLSETDDEDDFLAERIADIELPDDVNPHAVLAILFEGFLERLQAQGISAGGLSQSTA